MTTTHTQDPDRAITTLGEALQPGVCPVMDYPGYGPTVAVDLGISAASLWFAQMAAAGAKHIGDYMPMPGCTRNVYRLQDGRQVALNVFS